jgi:CheY-like chemotaxis protein/RNA polymerase subunit RPABC4/transcription elongation factor Spt4
MRTQARQDGMQLMAENAAHMVAAGITTVEEVLRVVDVAAETARCRNCEKAVEDTFTVCPHCGTPLRCACPSCGMQLQKEWHVCPYCGTAVKPAAAASPAAAPRPPAPSPATRTFRALVVDDQADMRRLAMYTLQSSGLPISVIEACNGPEALARAEEDMPDLVLLDIMMPGMDGFEVCERLRANVRTAFIPILMLTARDDADSRARGFMAGTDDYISKPFARAELLARVRRLIERTYGANLPPDPSNRRDAQPETDRVAAVQLSV